MAQNNIYGGSLGSKKGQSSAKSIDLVKPKSSQRPQEREDKGSVVVVGSIDYTALLAITLLLLIGIVMVFSASYYDAGEKFNDIFHFFRRQFIFAVAGFIGMIIVSKLDYRYWIFGSYLIYILANVLLIYVFFKADMTNGAARWIEIPFTEITVQPSEIAKVGVILLIPAIIHKNRGILETWPGFIFCSGVVLVSGLLVLLGNLSTAIVVCIIGFGIIFIASPHILRFVVAAGVAVVGLVAYIGIFATGFRGKRFDAWLDPFSDPEGYGYQIINSLYAVASGGLFGLGIGQSRQKSFIPEPYNDYIFAIICEELGIIGAGVVLFLFGIFIWRGIKIAINAVDLFSSLVAAGIVLMIGSQVVINVAVVTNTIPSTGIPLPFISYGGTSLLITLFLMGILLNISRYSKE